MGLGKNDDEMSICCKPQTFEKLKTNTFIKNASFSLGLEETAWGKMFVLTVGSFQVFIKKK